MNTHHARADFRFFHALRVCYVEVDMQKIVFNAHYLMHFDTAISDYWRALGLPYEAAMQQLGGDLYVKKATVEYHGSARFDDRLEVALKCQRIGNSSIAFSGAIFRDGMLLVNCELIYVFADPATQKPRPVPDAFRQLLLGFEAGEQLVTMQTGDWASQREDATRLRHEVFADEQGIARNLMVDAADAAAVHVLAFNRLGQPIGTGRVVQIGANLGANLGVSPGAGVSQIGRVAVNRVLRGSGVGLQIVQALLDAAAQRGDREVMLHAQRSAEGFYRRAGFTARGDYFEEAGIAHLEFFKAL